MWLPDSWTPIWQDGSHQALQIYCLSNQKALERFPYVYIHSVNFRKAHGYSLGIWTQYSQGTHYNQGGWVTTDRPRLHQGNHPII